MLRVHESVCLLPDQDQPGEDYVNFNFESYIEGGDGPEASKVILSVALGKNGEHEIEQSI